MSNQRTTFAKRQREQNRKDKLRSKQERLASRRAAAPGEKGPPIAWDEPGGVETTTDVTTDAPPAPQTDDVPGDG